MAHRRHILAIDVGGTHVKLRVSNHRAVKSFESSGSMTPRGMLKQVRAITQDWDFHTVSIGFPGMVIEGRIVIEPANLGPGWVGFDFARALQRPTRILNDAVMQAIGAYAGGRMLFLGFGTALGAVAILDSKVHPMELAHLPFTRRGLVQNYVGDEALRRLGIKRWSLNAIKLIKHLSASLGAQDVVISGGNAGRIRALPRHVRIGDNGLAFIGGYRSWRRRPQSL